MSKPAFELDIQANRRARKWSDREIAARVAWATARPLFRFSPRVLWGWRRWLLRLFGAQIAEEVHVHPGARIAMPWNLEMGASSSVGDSARLYNLGRITIGRNATISQGAHLCAGTHDFRSPDMALLKPPIVVEAEAWVCADAFVGPGVTVGSSAVVGARAVVVRDVPARAIVVGNPARIVGQR